MASTRRSLLSLVATVALLVVVSCSSGEEAPAGGAGTGGSTGGSGGTAGTGGTAAGTGGAGGTAGTGTGGSAGVGVGGSAGTGGTAGAAVGGTAGSAGALGGAGAAGAAGSAGSGGMSGTSGASGAAGAAGSSGGTSGAAGSAGAGGASGSAGSAGSGGSGGGGAFTLTIEGFTPMAGCGPMQMASSCAVWPRDLQQWMQGPNLSPAMSWANAPGGTMSFAVSLQDLSNENKHWVLWNLPASTMMLAEDVPDDMMNQASIGSGNGYFGPGSNCNVYEFTVYALGVATFSPNSATDPAAVFDQLNALGGQLLGKASVRGRQNFSGTCNP